MYTCFSLAFLPFKFPFHCYPMFQDGRARGTRAPGAAYGTVTESAQNGKLFPADGAKQK